MTIGTVANKRPKHIANFRSGNEASWHFLLGKTRAQLDTMYGRVLRHLRESKERSQAEVARSVGISPAQLARLEASQRGLYIQDFVNIVEALGEKPGNLLPNDLGDIGHLKPLIDRLAAVKPEFLPRVAAIIGRIVLLTEEVAAGTPQEPARVPQRKPAAPRKARR
jgi:transcriptional regulator with XRE-family HTH domain